MAFHCHLDGNAPGQDPEWGGSLGGWHPLCFGPAANDILRASQPGDAVVQELVLLSLITLSPCLVPPLMISLGGKTGEALLHRFSLWLKPRQRTIGLLVFFGMATYLVISGLQQL